MTDEDLKEIKEIEVELKGLVEKRYGGIEDFDDRKRVVTFLKVHNALARLMKKDFDYTLVVTNKLIPSDKNV